MVYSKWVVASVGCLAFVTLGAGCKSADDEDAKPVPQDQFPQTFAKALCDAVGPCCSQASLPYTATECQGAATDDFTSYVTRASSANTRYDAEAAGKCLAALRQQIQGCHPSSVGDDACDAIFVGTLADGQACTFAEECVSGRCFGSVCTPKLDQSQHGKAGEPCLGQCGTFDGESGCLTAQSPVDPNSPTPTAYCYESDGLYCGYDETALSPDGLPPALVCKAFVKLGEDCTGARCIAGSYCDYDQAVCVPQKDSGPCESADVCSSKSYCTGSSLGGPGQCVARKPDGFACTAGNECASGSCAGGTADHRSCGKSSNGVTASDCSGNF